MRTIDSGVMTKALAASRIISTRMTVRDMRLMFDTKTHSTSVVIGGSTYSMTVDPTATFEAALFNGGILRVSSFDQTHTPASGTKHLVYHWNHDLSDAHWQDNWADIGVDSKYNSVPGLYVNGTSYVYMFYHSLSDSKIHRIRFNGTTWDNDTVMFEFPNYGNSWVVLMPISTTFFYMNIRPVNDTDAGLHYSQIYKVDTGVYTSYTNLSADASCVLLYLFQDPVDQTATPQTVPVQYNFDLVTLDSVDYLFYPDLESKRTHYIPIYANSYCGDPKPWLPLDIVDDDSYFKLGGVSIVNSKICLTGVLSRVYGKSMHIYSFGPDHWSLGRDIFIRGASSIDATHVCPGGKMFDANNKLYYVSLGEVMIASKTYLVGYDDAAKKLVIEENVGGTKNDLISASLTLASNQAYSGVVDIKSSQISSLIRPGSRIDFDAAYKDTIGNYYYAPLAGFEIDSIPRSATQVGKTQELVLSSFALKRLRQWIPDCSYDYWSQTKQAIDVCNSGTLTAPIISGLIRSSGTWTGDGSKVWVAGRGTYDLMFTEERATHGVLAKARFDFGSSLPSAAQPWVGVVFNCYQETKAEAAIRLNKSEGSVIATDYSNNYMMLEKGSAVDTVYFTVIQNGVLKLAKASTTTITCPTTPFWLAAYFQEGKLRGYYRLDSSTAWTALAWTDIHDYVDDTWCHRADFSGRGGIWMDNYTASTVHYGMTPSSTSVAVNSNALFTVDQYIWADNEKMQVNTKSGNYSISNLSKQTYYLTNGTYSYTTYDSTAMYWVLTESTTIEGYTYFIGAYKAGYWQPYGDVLVTKVEARVGVKTGSGDIPNAWKLGFDRMGTEPYPYSGDWVIYADNLTAKQSAAWTAVEGPNPVIVPSSAGVVLEVYYKLTDNDGVWVVGDNTAGTSLADLWYHENTAHGGGSGEWVGYAIPLKTSGYKLASPYTNANYICLKGTGLEEPPSPTSKYDGCAVYVSSGTGAGNWAIIQDYIETNFYAPNGGNIFSLNTPLEALTDGTSVFKIMPAITVKNRGAGGTEVTSHASGGYLYLDSGTYVPTCDRFEYYSTDMDLRIKDLISEVAGKAGVSVSCEVARAYNGETVTTMPIQFTVGSGQTNSYSAQRVIKQNHIVKMKTTSLAQGNSFGLSARNNGTNALDLRIKNDATYGYIIEYTNKTSSTYTLRERFPLSANYPASSWITFSIQGNVMSIWIADCYLYTFRLTSADALLTGDCYFVATTGASGVTVDVDWTELDERVDNYIFDMGVSNGQSIITDLIREKRVFFQDTQSGVLHAFRNRTTINTGASYDLTIQPYGAKTDSGIASRIMLDGIDIVEEYNETLLKEYGNVFYYGNSERLDTKHDMEVEVQNTFTDMRGRSSGYRVIGALDPRLEPNDIILADVLNESGSIVSKSIVAEEMRIQIAGGDNPILDMEVTGYEAV